VRPAVLLGIILAGLGAFILSRGLTYRSRSNVISIGDVKASVAERHTVPAWAGALAVAAGLVLIGAGVRRRA
jgi:hypothetical protein